MCKIIPTIQLRAEKRIPPKANNKLITIDRIPTKSGFFSFLAYYETPKIITTKLYQKK